MKRFTKMLALGMAAALAFGMTVSAAPSKDTVDSIEDVVNVITNSAGVQDSQGNVLENPPRVEAAPLPEEVYGEAFGQNYEEACSKAINSAAVSPKIDAVFAEVFPGVSTNRMMLYSDIIDINVEGEIPEGGLYVPVWVSGDSEAYVVAHWNGIEWEVLQTKVENGYVYALFPSGFSPVSLTIVTVGEEVEVPGGSDSVDGDNNAGSSTGTGDSVVDTVNKIIDEAGVQDSQGNALQNPLVVNVNPLITDAFGTSYEGVCNQVISSAAVKPKLDSVFAEVFPGVSADRMELDTKMLDISVEGEIPEGGLYVPVWRASEGEAYVVAHWNGQEWEVLPTKTENGYVYALFTSFSPVGITIVTVGEEKADDNNNNNNSNDSTGSNNGTGSSTTPTSPKTGETVPAAGILAVLCLAGVAVCAKKARYNR